jgi:FkbM family methyltransferase
VTSQAPNGYCVEKMRVVAPEFKTMLFLGRLMRMLPVGMPGKARLARRLLGDGLTTEDVIVRARDASVFLVPSLSDSVGFHLFIDGVYEPTEIGWVLGRLAPGDVFVDVGANIGVFTVAASNRVGPDGRVVAVEASPRVAAYLAHNIARNALTNVTICQVAAEAHSDCAVQFYDAPIGRFGSGALTSEYGGTAIQVPSKRLDDLLSQINLADVKVLKVDVEGFEERVLRGAERLLRQAKPPAVLFEFHEWAERHAGQVGGAQRLLDQWGYRIWSLRGFGKRALPIDCRSFGQYTGSLVAIHSHSV